MRGALSDVVLLVVLLLFFGFAWTFATDSAVRDGCARGAMCAEVGACEFVGDDDALARPIRSP